jgi:hypothetical protein
MTNIFLLAIPIACIAWTVTQEEVFREPREYCQKRSKEHPKWYGRKFFYLPTCHYCFSHYVTLGILLVTGQKFILDNFFGYILAGFALVWIANTYMTVYAILRQILKGLTLRGKRLEQELQK